MIEQIRQGDIPGVQLRYRHEFSCAPTEIWPWLTEVNYQSRWLADRAEDLADPPGAILLESHVADGAAMRESISTVAIDPPNRWTLDLKNMDGSWPTPTRVEIEVTAVARGTEVSILQTGFAHLPLSDCLTIWEAYRHRWRQALSALETQIETSNQDGD